MEGLLFCIFWIGGAAIHTFIELRQRSAEVVTVPATSFDGRGCHSGGDSRWGGSQNMRGIQELPKDKTHQGAEHYE